MQDSAPAGEEVVTAPAGSRTLRNTALVLAARVVSRLIALVTVIATLNHLGAAGFGSFQDLVNYTAVAAMVVDLGFNTLYVRESARRPAELDRYLQNLLASKAVLALAGLLALALLLRIPNLQSLLLPGFLLMVLTSYSNLLRGTLYARQRLGFEAAGIVLEALVLLSLVAYGVRAQRGVGYFVWAYAISYGFSCAYFAAVLTATKQARLGLRIEPRLLRAWAWKGLPFALSSVITTLYFRIDVPILYQIRGATETGWYSSAYKPFEALLFVPLTMVNVVFPVLSRMHTRAPDRVLRSTARFSRALVLLGWPACVGTFMLAPGITSGLHLYPQSEPALRILALGIAFMFLNNAFIAALNSIDRQVDFTVISVVSLVANVALNIVLIPSLGYLGAAWATVATEVVLTAAGWIAVRRRLGPVSVLRASGRILAAGAVMAVVLVPFRDVHGPAFVLVAAVGAAVYGAAVLVLRALPADEIAVLRRAVAIR